MSSHFMPLPRSSMMRASSSGDHLLCFFAGDSDVCDGMLRFPPPLPGRDAVLDPGACPDPAAAAETLCPLARTPPTPPRRGDNGPAATANEASGGPPEGSVTAADGWAEVGVGCWVGDTEDSFESGPLRREAISTMTVSLGNVPKRAVDSWAPEAAPWLWSDPGFRGNPRGTSRPDVSSVEIRSIPLGWPSRC